MSYNGTALIHSQFATSRRSRVPLALGVALLAACIAPVTTAWSQTPPADPLVKEGATVSVAHHTWVIPDGDVGLVPNVGIIVGSRGVLVIDPGLGRRNGETVLREVAKVAAGRPLFVAKSEAPEPVDLAMARAARLVHANDTSNAVPVVCAALAAAPPGNGGWLLAIEPLLRVAHAPDAWAPALAVLHLRAR